MFQIFQRSYRQPPDDVLIPESIIRELLSEVEMVIRVDGEKYPKLVTLYKELTEK